MTLKAKITVAAFWISFGFITASLIALVALSI